MIQDNERSKVSVVPGHALSRCATRHDGDMSVTTWFVTGASRGFGRELSEQLLARGHRVAATLRRPEQLDDLASRHQDRLWVRALDVTDTGQMRRVVAEAFADLGRVDVVVSNAGFGVFGAAEDLTDAQVEAMIATNLTASIQLARAVVPYLRGQAAAACCSCRAWAGTSPSRPSRCTTQPSGASRPSMSRWLWRSSRSASAPCWSSQI